MLCALRNDSYPTTRGETSERTLFSVIMSTLHSVQRGLPGRHRMQYLSTRVGSATVQVPGLCLNARDTEETSEAERKGR